MNWYFECKEITYIHKTSDLVWKIKLYTCWRLKIRVVLGGISSFLNIKRKICKSVKFGFDYRITFQICGCKLWIT